MGLIDTFDFTPNPISLLESNRNLGYLIQEAIADLIDNSISAGATEISYELNWNNGVPFFLLKDNGCGMTNEENELVDSFRLGSKNPLELRPPEDLGRFGFGMKTASLSQARILSVFTRKKDQGIFALALDLNFISAQKKWHLKTVEKNLFPDEIRFLESIESGTIIRWDDWDRAPKNQEDFNSLTTQIRNYISVCFHRFLSKGIKILNFDFPIEPCSPIPDGDGATLFSEVPLTKNKKARQRSYVLQHPKNWIGDFENQFNFNSFRLFEGFERQQGIYIYRCDRLLNPKGGWLGLLKQNNASKLARVIIDYPNDADSLWSLDITKTKATIPFEFKMEILKLINATKQGSVNKIIKGNRIINRNLIFNNAHIWSAVINNEFNCYNYLIDIEHPFFQNYIINKKITLSDLKCLLSTVSDNLPVAKIIDNNDVDPSKHDRIFKRQELTKGELLIAEAIIKEKLKTATKAESITWLLGFEPYCYCEEQIKKIFYE
jgi:hypothetical protein